MHGACTIAAADDRITAASALDPEAVFGSTGITLQGSITWIVSCPEDGQHSDAATEFHAQHIVVYRDNAGYPGALIGSTDVDFTVDLSCASRDMEYLPGYASMQPLAPTLVTDLSALCAEYASAPQGSPLYAQVELDATATDCSSQQTAVVLRGRIAVTCP